MVRLFYFLCLLYSVEISAPVQCKPAREYMEDFCVIGLWMGRE